MTDGPHDDDCAIRVEGLTKRFGATLAVDDLTLDVRRNEVFGIIGPDGAGKTTLLRLLCGVVRPDSGTAIVAGRDVTRDPEGVKTRIGYLSQAFSLYGDLTIEENMDFCADLYLTPRAEVTRLKEEMLDMTDLARFRTRQVGRLSGGMKQKVGLICALIHRPEALILDEPTTGVDPVSRRDFWRILSGLPGQGVTVLLSSPYMDEATRCHRLALMHRGRIVAQGTTDELRASVPGVVVEVVTPDVRLAARTLQGLPGVIGVTPFGDAVHVHAEQGLDAETVVAQALRDAGLPDATVGRITASLEDAFVDTVSRASRDAA